MIQSQESLINKSYLLIILSLNFAPIEKILAGTDFDQEVLSNDGTLKVSDAISLLNNLEQNSYTPNWAAIFGAHLGVATHGPVGYATIAAPTLGEALSTFVNWFQIRCETYTSEVNETEDEIIINIQDTTGSKLFEQFYFEAFMRAFEVLIALIMGERLKGQTTLEFKSLAENRKQLMIEEYDSQLIFGAKENLFRVPKLLWEQDSPLSDPSAHQLNLRACEQIKAERQARGQIELMVKALLDQHFENILEGTKPEPPPTLQNICERLHMTERTLIRKLKQKNTAYKTLLEETRFSFAERMLQNARYSISDVGDRLGYREAANFCRAFKRWSGQSPSAYRRNPI